MVSDDMPPKLLSVLSALYHRTIPDSPDAWRWGVATDFPESANISSAGCTGAR